MNLKEKMAGAKNKVLVSAAGVGAALAPAAAFASDPATPPDAMTTVTTALGTSISGVASSIGTAVGDNLPVILGVAAIFIVIPAVWKLAKRFTK